MQSTFRWNEFLPSGVVVTTILAMATFTVSLVAEDAKVAHPAAAEARSRMSASYGKLPISFEVNQGQTDKSVQFLARGAGYTLFLTPGEAVLSLHAPHAKAEKAGSLGGPGEASARGGKAEPAVPSSTVRLQLMGANTKAEVQGVDPLPGKTNYFVGNDPAKWHTDVPTYEKVRYSNVYPGVDLVYYGDQEGRLEHDFVVAPGADPNAIAICLQDSDGVVAEKDGGITLHTKSGDLSLHSPTVYQTIGGERKTIPASYLLADNQIKFQLGSYDRKAALVIDPVLVYTAEFGYTGNGILLGQIALAVDSAGQAYVTGDAQSNDFPVVNAYQNTWTPTGSQSGAAFVGKINAAGTAFIYSTYLGGPQTDYSGFKTGIAADSAGRAYVVGYTLGSGFPTTKSAYQPTGFAGNLNAFFSVLSPTGDSLVYSTYLGDQGFGRAEAIALDNAGNAYITGQSYGSVGFTALHTIAPEGSFFVAKFNSAGELQYSTLFGSGNHGGATSIAVDSAGAAYVAGTVSPYYNDSLPTTPHAFEPSCPKADGSCAFAAKVSPSGSTLGYLTYLVGKSASTSANAIAVDSDGQAYVAGSTLSGYPVTSNALEKTYSGQSDGFVSKLNANGTGLMWSTYTASAGLSIGSFVNCLALDRFRNVYIAGYSYGPIPLKAPVWSRGGQQSFIMTLSGNLSSIVYFSTYFPPLYTLGIAVDPQLNVYVAGRAIPDLPPTAGALDAGPQRTLFVSKLVIMDDIALGVSGTPSPVVHGGNLTYTIAVTSKGPDFGYNVRVADTLPTGTTFVSYGAGGGTCTAPAVGATGTLNCTLPQLNAGATWNVTLTVNVNAASGTNLSNTAAAISNMQDFVPANNSGTLTTHVN